MDYVALTSVWRKTLRRIDFSIIVDKTAASLKFTCDLLLSMTTTVDSQRGRFESRFLKFRNRPLEFINDA